MDARCMLAFHRLLLRLLFCGRGLCKQRDDSDVELLCNMFRKIRCYILYISSVCSIGDIYRLGLRRFK